MHKKFDINQKKIKGGCQSGIKVVAHNSNSYLPLVSQQSAGNSDLYCLVYSTQKFACPCKVKIVFILLPNIRMSTVSNNHKSQLLVT